MAYSSSSSPEISVGPAIDTQDHFSYKHATHDEVLEDLSSRFILNLPDEELASLERICFQVEQAHWFYEDFIREENPKFPSLPLKKFSAMLFHACPLLHQWSHDHEQAFNTFMQYKTRVPVCGAIMLNDTWEKCILVKGWKSSSGWGFPKGKINEHEAPHDCAVREVLEETGYNLAGEVDPQDVIEMSIKEQKISLFIVAGVPEDFHFQTRTRKEISRIEWFKLTDLPTWKRNKAASGKFYLISPFIGALKAFINERKPRALLRKSPMKGRTASMPPSVQARQKQIPNSFSLQFMGTYHDPAAQESSSQSSSADNGGPHTPSPQYTEPIANHPANGHIVAAHAEDDISITSMDPNLARLLNSLEMSAAIPADDKDSTKPSLTPLSILSLPLASTTPLPITASSASPMLPQRSEQADWSSHVPMPLSERPTDTLQAPTSSCHGSASIGSQRLSNFTQSSYQVPPALSLSPCPNGANAAASDFHQGSPTPLSAALSAASISSTASSTTSAARKPSSRRNSSTADISPYLARSSEIPTSGKRLKQLALLETVADESARMTPQQVNRQQHPQPGGPNNSAQGYQLPLGGQHSFAPGLPAPVPPASTNHDTNDLRVIYSSEHGPAPMQPGQSYHPQPPPPHHYDDPFQVRPRSSQALHPGGTYSGHPFSGRPTGMHQSQLLSLLTGPGPQGPNPLSTPTPPPAPQLIGSYPHPIHGPPPRTFQHSMPVRGPPPPPLHVMPHNSYPPQRQPVPASAPALSPTFDLPTAPNNLNLLSILNGPKPVTTGSAHGRNTIAPPGVLNGVMRR